MDNSNNLRVNLYKLLIPEIQKQDLATGIDSYLHFYDGNVLYDSGALWDEIGLFPVIKNFFYAIESAEGDDLGFIDNLKQLIDPDTCPEKYLDVFAQGLGLSLSATTEAEKRLQIKGSIQLQKTFGKELSWKVFFRYLGQQVKAIPLYKKHLFETNEYSREKFVTELVTNEVHGTAGNISYLFQLQKPILPKSLRVNNNGVIYRDDGEPLSKSFGKLISNDGATGKINYATGILEVNLPSAAIAQLTCSYSIITDEFPYQAARIDLEFVLVPDSGLVVDSTLVNKIINQSNIVRPIHVIVRALLLTLAVDEILIDYVSDDACKCGPTAGVDIRAAQHRTYLLDVANSPQDQEVLIDIGDKILNLDDLCNAQAQDTLRITFTNGQPDILS